MSYQTEQEAIESAMSDNAMIDFEGKNCNDYLDEIDLPCAGWDGKSSRCDCGNRRVFWEFIRNEDGTIEYAYAKAY